MGKTPMAVRSGLVAILTWPMALSVQAEEATDLMAGVPSVDQLVEALTPAKRELTRGIRVASEAEVEASRPAVDLAVTFEFDSDDLTPKAQAILDNLATAMNTDLAAYQFVLEGHTDGVGDSGYNQGLSERRARAVRDYLVELYDVAGTRMTAVGKGEQDLLLPQEPGAAANRRVRVINGG
jgi:outer membrane protein OmpA-like peptidoglycan-associated protein